MNKQKCSCGRECSEANSFTIDDKIYCDNCAAYCGLCGESHMMDDLIDEEDIHKCVWCVAEKTHAEVLKIMESHDGTTLDSFVGLFEMTVHKDDEIYEFNYGHCTFTISTVDCDKPTLKNHVEVWTNNSTLSQTVVVGMGGKVSTDYVYEIVDGDDNVIGNGYAALDAAIEFAEENGGVMINYVCYPLGEDGTADLSQNIIHSEVIWNDLPLVEILAMKNHPEGKETATALFEQQKTARAARIEKNKKATPPPDKHYCKYCGKWADGIDPGILCADCRQTFGHKYYCEL